MKDRYSVYDAKAKLSEILRQLKRSHSVVITERGVDVARVIPAEPASGLDKRIKALYQSGVITMNPSADPRKIGPVARRPGALKRFMASRHRY